MPHSPSTPPLSWYFDGTSLVPTQRFRTQRSANLANADQSNATAITFHFRDGRYLTIPRILLQLAIDPNNPSKPSLLSSFASARNGQARIVSFQLHNDTFPAFNLLIRFFSCLYVDLTCPPSNLPDTAIRWDVPPMYQAVFARFELPHVPPPPSTLPDMAENARFLHVWLPLVALHGTRPLPPRFRTLFTRRVALALPELLRWLSHCPYCGPTSAPRPQDPSTWVTPSSFSEPLSPTTPDAPVTPATPSSFHDTIPPPDPCPWLRAATANIPGVTPPPLTSRAGFAPPLSSPAMADSSVFCPPTPPCPPARDVFTASPRCFKTSRHVIPMPSMAPPLAHPRGSPPSLGQFHASHPPSSRSKSSSCPFCLSQPDRSVWHVLHRAGILSGVVHTAVRTAGRQTAGVLLDVVTERLADVQEESAAVTILTDAQWTAGWMRVLRDAPETLTAQWSARAWRVAARAMAHGALARPALGGAVVRVGAPGTDVDARRGDALWGLWPVRIAAGWQGMALKVGVKVEATPRSVVEAGRGVEVVVEMLPDCGCEMGCARDKKVRPTWLGDRRREVSTDWGVVTSCGLGVELVSAEQFARFVHVHQPTCAVVVYALVSDAVRPEGGDRSPTSVRGALEEMWKGNCTASVLSGPGPAVMQQGCDMVCACRRCSMFGNRI